MISTDDTFGAVTVVVPSGTLARYTVFELALEGLKLPKGSSIGRARGPSVAKNRNEVIRLSKTPWYWLIDDDHDFDSHIVAQLATHNVPVVAALTVLKQPPFYPTIFSGQQTHPDGTPVYEQVTWKDLQGKAGLYQAHACNVSGMLIKREVFETLTPPWFRLGQENPEIAHEDVYFCKMLREAGIPVLVDLDTPMSHVAPVGAKPCRQSDGSWCLQLVWDNGQALAFRVQ